MPITFDAVQSFGNRAVLDVVKELWDIGRSLPFDSSYLVADSYGNKYLYPGMVVAYSGTYADQYAPYSASASYGTYSDAPVGVIYELYDCTMQQQIVAPATRAALVEQYCYVFGGTLGDIPDAVKTATGMKLIQWD